MKKTYIDKDGTKQKYFRLDEIRKRCPDAIYYIIYGERSNGKTFAVEELIIQNYFEGRGQGAIIRRWDDDIKGALGQDTFSGVVSQKIVEKYSHGKWTGIYYYNRRWYFCKDSDKGRVVDKEPFCYSFSLNRMEHYKSTDYPGVTTILFDEFMSRKGYLPDEFVLFMNMISTIVRRRDNVTIYCLGNTVNKYCPYFENFGLTHIRQQKIGTIDVYQYGENSEYKIACQYADSPVEKKPSDKYFAFGNQKLKMITRGAWEMAIYPHAPERIKPKDIKFRYFIKFQEDLLECDVIMNGRKNYTYIHRKTTPLKDPDHDLIYDTEYNSLFNFGRRLTKPATNIQKKIKWYFDADKVFYQDNEVGEIVRNYSIWSSTTQIS